MLRAPPLRRAIQSGQDRLIAAVGYVVNQKATAARLLDRLQNAELALIFDQVTARRLVEVGDADVQRMLRIQRAVDGPVQTLVCAYRAKLSSSKHR